MLFTTVIKQLAFISTLLIMQSCGGQNEPLKEGATVQRVVDYYNRESYDSIFYLFSQEMKDALPLDKTKDFFSQLHKDAGLLIKFTFVTWKGSFARHKAEFTNTVLWLDISENKFGKIDGLLFTPYDAPEKKTSFLRNQTKMSLPFYGEWLVFWGGDTKEENYHISSKAQRHAFDIVMTDSVGKTYRTDGKSNEDYYAFGQHLIAPCDAKVVAVIEGVKDNVPGEMNPEQLTGNSVVLKTATNEYLLLAHFKLNSIKVKVGDSIKGGQLLGHCGNSGNSSEAHLHFHIQNQEKLAGADGFKCYFEKLMVNGEMKTDYSPVKGERIKNAD